MDRETHLTNNLNNFHHSRAEWKYQILSPEPVFNRVKMRLNQLTPGKAFAANVIQPDLGQGAMKDV